MEEERSNIYHRLKLCTFGVELLGTGSGNMASDIVQGNALGRRFDNLNIDMDTLSNIICRTSDQIFSIDSSCARLASSYWEAEVEIWRRI